MSGCHRGDERRASASSWLDGKRACRECGVVGLRYGSKSGMCGACYNPLSTVIKANINDLSLDAVTARFKHVMLEQFGLARAAEEMQIDPAALAKWTVDRFGLDAAAALLQVDPQTVSQLYKPPPTRAHWASLRERPPADAYARWRADAKPARQATALHRWLAGQLGLALAAPLRVDPQQLGDLCKAPAPAAAAKRHRGRRPALDRFKTAA